MDAPPPTETRPTFPAEMHTVRQELEELFTATPLYAVLGIDLLEWGPGWAIACMTTAPEFGNLAGSLHGGVSFSLADAAFEIACNSHGRASVALEVTCHHHRPAPLGATITADCWEVARGGRTATYRIRVVDEHGMLCSSYLALAYRTSKWHVEQEKFPADWG